MFKTNITLTQFRFEINSQNLINYIVTHFTEVMRTLGCNRFIDNFFTKIAQKCFLNSIQKFL